MHVEPRFLEDSLQLLARDARDDGQLDAIDEVVNFFQIFKLPRLAALQAVGHDLAPRHQEVSIFLNDGCCCSF